MKSLKVIIPLAFVLTLLFPMALFAQESSPEATLSPDAISLLDALDIVKAAYGADTVILEISYEDGNDDSQDDDDRNDDSNDDDFQTACWEFTLANRTKVCVDALTGEILLANLGAEATPEATQDTDDDDSDDDSNDDSDDSTATPLVSLEEAVAIALAVFPDATVTNIELDDMDDDTLLVWDIELAGNRSVDVDAMTGAILSFGYESADDNDYSDDDDDSNDDSNDDRNDDSDDDDSNDDDSNDDSDDDDSNDDSNDDDSNDDSDDDDSDDSDDD